MFPLPERPATPRIEWHEIITQIDEYPGLYGVAVSRFLKKHNFNNVQSVMFLAGKVTVSFGNSQWMDINYTTLMDYQDDRI